MTDPSNDEIQQIQKEGYQALLDGKSPRENPYQWADNARYLAWNAGYAWSRTDKATRMLKKTQTEES